MVAELVKKKEGTHREPPSHTVKHGHPRYVYLVIANEVPLSMTALDEHKKSYKCIVACESEENAEMLGKGIYAPKPYTVECYDLKVALKEAASHGLRGVWIRDIGEIVKL